jgi:FMN-dependent NADH-azoreductase
MKLLNIQSSANLQSSNTREVSQALIAELKKKHPGLEIMNRDVAQQAVAQISPLCLGAMFTPAEQRTSDQKNAVQLSDQLTTEFMGADLIVIGSPMYNFSVPSSLKAWIDAIVRAGITFKYTEKGPVGLVSDQKTVVLVTSSGGTYEGTPYAAMEMNDKYLRGILGFLGIKKFHSIKVESTAMGPDAHQKSKTTALEQMAKIVSQI